MTGFGHEYFPCTITFVKCGVVDTPMTVGWTRGNGVRIVLGVNRIGKDGNGLIYNGQSLLVDFEGQIKIDAQDNSGMFHFNLDDEKLNSFKDKFPFYVSADPFLL
jgi:hypothetical protein